MAYIDPHREELVLRVVYDGAPGAGKTTNIRWLHEHVLGLREGVLESPHSVDRSTEYFDARDFPVGYVEGKRVRGQLLSVPGQPDRRSRRRHLISLADAVVFVATPSSVEQSESRAMIRSLSAWLAERSTPLLVQVNKLDLAPDRALEAVAEDLRLSPSVSLLGARADVGVGVAETFLAAMRCAMASARASLHRGVIVRESRALSPDELLAEIRTLEGQATPSK